jgi:uncharacterized protein YdcH (DUF465 family)
LIRDIVEFNQRKDLVSIQKGRMKLKLKDKIVEILNANGKTFLFDGTVIKKVEDKIVDSSMEEVEKAMSEQKETEFVQFNPEIFKILKKEIGSFEIIL